MEIKRLKQLSDIERKLQRSGTDPKSLLYTNTKRTFLDKVNVPRKIKCVSPCCYFKISYMCAVFMMMMVDITILVRYFVTLWEMDYYSEDYPESVKIEVKFKTALLALMVFIEGVMIIKYKLFGFCKVAYALRIV